MSIYEPLFLPTSFGFRPGKNCHQALRALTNHTYHQYDGAVVEINLRKFFNTLPHDKVMNCLERKISDTRFLRLVNKLMKTPIIEESGVVVPNEVRCPQGSAISPTIADLYLHEVIDEWFEETKRNHLMGNAEMDAERFYRVLPKRLEKYGLKFHEEKSQLIQSGQIAAKRALEKREKLPTYKFLGFTCYWGKSRNGFWRLKYTSRRVRFTTRLTGLRRYLWENLNSRDSFGLLKTVVRVVKGWVNYHVISDNQRRVSAFLIHAEKILFSWFNRRGRKYPISWDSFKKLLKRIKFKVVSMFPKAIR